MFLFLETNGISLSQSEHNHADLNATRTPNPDRPRSTANPVKRTHQRTDGPIEDLLLPT